MNNKNNKVDELLKIQHECMYIDLVVVVVDTLTDEQQQQQQQQQKDQSTCISFSIFKNTIEEADHTSRLPHCMLSNWSDVPLQ